MNGKRWAFLAILLLAFLLLSGQPAQASDLSPGSAARRSLYRHSHTLSAGTIVMFPPVNVADPYASGVGARCAYTFQGFRRFEPEQRRAPGFFLQIDGSWLSFQPTEENKASYGTSRMVLVGASMGYEFLLPFIRANPLGLALFGGYRHYFSSHTFQNVRYTSMKPMAAAGVRANLFFLPRAFTSIIFEQDLAFEQTVILSYNLTVGLGVAL